MIDFRQSNFNSASPGSALWLVQPQTGASSSAGNTEPMRVQAFQGRNVYTDAQALIHWRYQNQVGFAARAAANVNTPGGRTLLEGAGTGGAINRSDLLMLKVWIGELNWGEGDVSRQSKQALMDIVQGVVDSQQMTPACMALILWFTYGANSGIPWWAYGVPANTVFPAVGTAPPPPEPLALTSVLTIDNSKEAIPANLRPAADVFAAMPQQLGGATNPANSPVGTQPPMDWLPWLIGGAAVLAAIGLAVATYYVVRGIKRRREDRQLGSAVRRALPARAT